MTKNFAAKKAPPALTDEAFELIAARFRILSEPMRLKILHALMEGEMTVGQLVTHTAAGQANISKHLGILQEAGMVARRKEGLCAYYRIADESVFDHCEKICLGLGQHYEERQQVVRRFTAQHHPKSK
jgi:DNA-binding transcriptional ArsR family regulator